MFTNKFQTLAQLEQLTKALNRFEDGEKAYIEDEEKLYQYVAAEGIWKEITGMELQYTLYELNKTIIAALPDASEAEIEEGLEAINELDEVVNAKYYMLLCKELSYFTVLRRRKIKCEDATLAEALMSCLKPLGAIKSIEIRPEDSAAEIWMKIDDDIYCLYLFNYTTGVVDFGR